MPTYKMGLRLGVLLSTAYLYSFLVPTIAGLIGLLMSMNTVEEMGSIPFYGSLFGFAASIPWMINESHKNADKIEEARKNLRFYKHSLDNYEELVARGIIKEG